MKKTLVLPELLVQEQICPSTGLGGIVQVTFYAPPEYNKILVELVVLAAYVPALATVI